jgi:hypothetical protein
MECGIPGLGLTYVLLDQTDVFHIRNLAFGLKSLLEQYPSQYQAGSEGASSKK